MTTSGPGCGFHHSVLCGLSLLPSERSRLTIKEKISLNKLVVLFFSFFFSFLCPGPVVGKYVGELVYWLKRVISQVWGHSLIKQKGNMKR